jgi:UPF0755 protein
VLWGYGSLAVPAGGSGGAQVVDVRAGASLRFVTQRLRERGLIRSQAAFYVAARLSGLRLRAGAYRLDPRMSGWEILDQLRRGAIFAPMVTIPEGYTIRQIAEALQQGGVTAAAPFERAASTRASAFPTAFPKPADSLEGYLFPDTYKFSPGVAPEAIIARMLARFDEVVWSGLLGEPGAGSRLRLANRPASLHEIITLASLVEAEAKLDRERPLIAGVLARRLELGRRLECDATIQYILPERKSRLRGDDLKIESRYNTYRYAGLPPGPIDNPGRASIEAALHPARVDYLYYVARPDGSHIFSRTFEEHRQAIRRARAEARAAGGG